jgi:hypothetical protein
VVRGDDEYNSPWYPWFYCSPWFESHRNYRLLLAGPGSPGNHQRWMAAILDGIRNLDSKKKKIRNHRAC